MGRPKPAAGSKPHFSPTQLEMLSKCGLQWQFRYAEGIILPPNVAMAKGTAVHGAAEANFRQKIETRRDLPKAEIQEIAAAEWETVEEGGIEAREDESLDTGKDEAVELAGFFADAVAPDYQPLLVEKAVRIELPGPRDYLMVLDLATEAGVVDLKTSGRKKAQDDADASLQLTSYAVGYFRELGRWPESLALDTMVATTSKLSRQVLTTTRDEADANALAWRIDAAAAAIDAGRFLPAPVGAWWCSPKWCGYWNICPAVRKGGRDHG